MDTREGVHPRLTPIAAVWGSNNLSRESTMKPICTTPAAKMRLVRTAILSAALTSCATGIALADPIEKKGTSPYVTHFIFRPVQSLEVPGLGTATLLEALGTTQNMKGEKMFDKMSARCTALSVDSGSKK